MFIEPIVNMFKIKFVILEPIVNAKITEGEHVNIFINLETVLDRLYIYNTTKDVIRDLRGPERIALSSEIINLISHYRYFFWKTYSVTSTFYLYYGTTKPSYNCSLYDFYDYTSFEKKALNNTNHHETNMYISENLSLMKVVIDYIPDCYFIEVGDIEKSLIPYHVIGGYAQHKSHVNLILGKDLYDLQLLNIPNTFMLYLDRDSSSLLNKEDILPFFIHKNQGATDSFLSPELLSLICAFSGVKSRNIKGIRMIGAIRAIKYIEQMVANADIANAWMRDIERLRQFLNPEYAEMTINNFQLIDLPHQYLQLTSGQKYNIDKSLEINKYDLESLMQINSEYYSQNPIDINRVFRGVR